MTWQEEDEMYDLRRNNGKLVRICYDLIHIIEEHNCEANEDWMEKAKKDIEEGEV